MKGLFSKLIVVIAGAATFLGFSVANVTALAPTSVPQITSKSALYLEHGKSIGSSIVVCDHESHYSHSSHESHRSHQSGY
jgi:hypothetical protein